MWNSNGEQCLICKWKKRGIRKVEEMELVREIGAKKKHRIDSDVC
jgi:hypothetical protein